MATARKTAATRTAATAAPVKKTRRIKAVKPEATNPVPTQADEPLQNDAGQLDEQAAQQADPKFDLTTADVIDLRGVPALARVHVFAMLEKEGYIPGYHVHSTLLDQLHILLCEEAIELQHKNKLAFPKTWGNVCEHARITTVNHFHAKTKLDFSEPAVLPPAIISVNGQAYQAV